VRFFSAERIIRDIDNLVRESGVRNVDFYDDTFTLHPEFNKIMEGISKYNISFTCLTRVNVLNEDKLRMLKDSGCYAIRMGIETGNERILKAIRKKITKDQARKVLALCKKYKMWTNCCFIFGFPDETTATAEETIRFALELDPDLAFFYILMPLPGTDIENEMRRNNLILSDVYYEFVAKSTCVRTRHLSSNELVDIRKNAYRRFYLRPRYVFKMLSKVRRLNDVMNYWNGFTSIVR
jgi:radical SAM superfamily enzyme YgiQ (UPF0313 family)